ncbi:MAG: hypothetical protein ACWA6U_17615 [Breznakibacter sp.]
MEAIVSSANGRRTKVVLPYSVPQGSLNGSANNYIYFKWGCGATSCHGIDTNGLISAKRS